MLLTMKDKQRIEVIMAVLDGRIVVEEAERILKRSVRQIYRIVKRVREEGVTGVIHKSRGRESLQKLPEKMRERIVRLTREKYLNVSAMCTCGSFLSGRRGSG